MKQILIPAILLIAAALYFKPKKKQGSNLNEIPNMYTATDARDALLLVSKTYGKQMAADVERMTRLETRHYASGQFTKCGTPGMTVGKWSGLPANLPTTDFIVDGKKYTYYVWNPKDAFLYLAAYIQRNNGNWAQWNSTNAVAQEEYRKRVNGVLNKFIV